MPNIGDIIRAEDLQDLLEQINNNSNNIIGELKYFGFSEVPEHCLMCDGSEISRETYSELFAKYGTTYGEGDGSTTFNIPDYRGAFLRCIGGNAAELGVEQEDAIRDITGSFCIRRSDSGSELISTTKGLLLGAFFSMPDRTLSSLWQSSISGGSRTIQQIGFKSSAVVPTANENRPINYAVNVCIIYE